MPDRSPFAPSFSCCWSLAAVAVAASAPTTRASGTGSSRQPVRRALPPEGTTHVYVWPGPWHGGFFPIFPLFGLVILFLLLRGLLWARPVARRARGRLRTGWPDGAADGVPPAFDEWHRRAHERMAGTPPPPQRTPTR